MLLAVFFSSMPDVSLGHMYILHMPWDRKSEAAFFNSLLPAQTPHVLSVTCRFWWGSCWEFLFKGEVFLKERVQIGQTALKKIPSVSDSNIVLFGLDTN